MNNIIKRVWNQNRLVNIEDLTGMVFQAEAGGHTFEISGIDDTGAAVELSGTVSGVFRRPDNADIALTGSASDGVVSVTLSEDCYAVPGRFGLTIFVTSNSQKVAVYACVGTVAASSTGNVAGDTPASVEDLIDDINAAIADLNTAIGSIPADYSQFMAAIAPAYSSSALYAVGSYAWHDGDLYRCTTAITTAEAWTAAHWTAAVLGDDVNDLKSAIDVLPYAVYNPAGNTNGVWLDKDGNINTYTGWSITEFLRIGEEATYHIKTGITSPNVKSCFYDADKEFLSAFETYYDGTHILTPVTNAKYVRFSIQTAEASDFAYSSLLFVDKIANVGPTQLKDASVVKTYADEITTGRRYDTDGSDIAAANWSRTPLYNVKEGDVVRVTDAQGVYAVLFNSSKVVTEYKNRNSKGNAEFTVPSGTSFIGFNIVTANLPTYLCTVNGIILGGKYTIRWLSTANQDDSIWQNKTYISHGDSITWQDGKAYTQGEHSGEIANGYQTVFSEAVGLKNYNNQGKSGWSMAVVNGNGVVNTIMAIADYTVYDLCTIACGTNDFKLNVPIGTQGVIGDITFDDTTFYGAYRKAVEYILNSSPTIRLVLMTPLQRDNAGYDVNYTNSAGAKLIDYVNAIKEIGEMYGLPVCDMYGNSGFTKKTLTTYTMDGLHPNDVGYKRMGGYLTGFLNAVGN